MFAGGGAVSGGACRGGIGGPLADVTVTWWCDDGVVTLSLW